MSMIKKYEKKLTKTFVKSKERQDVDLQKLFKSAVNRIPMARPTYADLTGIPTSRGEAAQRLAQTTQNLDPDVLNYLLRLPPDQAIQAIQALRVPASLRDDKTTRLGQTPIPAQTPLQPQPPSSQEPSK